MPRKCCAPGCNSNYDSKNNLERITNRTIYKFPKEMWKLEQWLSSLPFIMHNEDVTDNIGLCSLHWPTDAEMENVYKSRFKSPKNPPSLFNNCLPSWFPQSQVKNRHIEDRNLSLEARNQQPDEIDCFNLRDIIVSYEEFTNRAVVEISQFAIIGSVK